MADIKTVISGIVDIQDKTISKLKFNNNAIVALSGALNSLSGYISENLDLSGYVDETTLTTNYYNKSETEDKINEIVSEVSGQISENIDFTDYYDKDETDNVINSKISEVSGQFATKSEIADLINEELDPKFAEASGQFALKSEIGSLIGEELDPKFAEVSGQFATKTDLDEFHTYDNLTYVNKIYQTIDQSKNAVPGFETFIEIPDATTSGEILDLRADDSFFSWIDGGQGKYSYAIRSVSNNTILNGNVYSLPTNVNNLKNLSIGRDVAFGIAENGDLYVARSRSYRKFSYQYKRWYNVRRNINNFYSIKLDSSS